MFILSDPTILPKNIAMAKGESKVIQCSSSNNELTWKFNDGELPANVVASWKGILILRANEGNAGHYECAFREADGVVYAQTTVFIIGRHFFLLS